MELVVRFVVKYCVTQQPANTVEYIKYTRALAERLVPCLSQNFVAKRQECLTPCAKIFYKKGYAINN